RDQSSMGSAPLDAFSSDASSGKSVLESANQSSGGAGGAGGGGGGILGTLAGFLIATRLGAGGTSGLRGRALRGATSCPMTSIFSPALTCTKLGEKREGSVWML